jgi:hypothetical protein
MWFIATKEEGQTRFSACPALTDSYLSVPTVWMKAGEEYGDVRNMEEYGDVLEEYGDVFIFLGIWGSSYLFFSNGTKNKSVPINQWY